MAAGPALGLAGRVRPGIEARASIVAERAGHRTRCQSLRSDPPIALRTTPDGLYVVGSAAGPIGGDAVHLDVAVGPEAALTVRSAAAAIVLPGPRGLPSSSTVKASVAAGATLRWLPEPTIAVQGCDHRATARLRLDDGAAVVWREELVLGRHGEGPGSVLLRLSADLGGRPLVRTELAVGPRWPGWDGPCGVGPARGAGAVLVVGPAAAGVTVRAPVPPGAVAAVLDLDGPAVLVSVVAAEPGGVREVLDEVVARMGA